MRIKGELAKLGITMIIERIERKLKGPPRQSLIGVSLVERASTSHLVTREGRVGARRTTS